MIVWICHEIHSDSDSEFWSTIQSGDRRDTFDISGNIGSIGARDTVLENFQHTLSGHIQMNHSNLPWDVHNHGGQYKTIAKVEVVEILVRKKKTEQRHTAYHQHPSFTRICVGTFSSFMLLPSFLGTAHMRTWHLHIQGV